MPKTNREQNQRTGNNYKQAPVGDKRRKNSTQHDSSTNNDYESTRYENERYEDSERNYDNPRHARRMSSRQENWDMTADEKPWSYAGTAERPSSRSREGERMRDENRMNNGMRNEERFSQSRPRRDFENQDYGMSYDQRALQSERGQYTQGGGYRGHSGSQRDDRYDSNSYNDRNPRQQHRDDFEPYSQGGRVYQDRYAQGPGRDDYRHSESGGGSYSRINDNYNEDSQRYGRDRHRERSFSDSSLGSQDRYSERGESYRSTEPSFMGRDQEQTVRGGRYGARGASGARRSNNNYLDESDDGYNYAYGSEAEEMSQSRRMGSSRSDFSNERAVTPGRARFSHGSEIQEDEDEAENFAPRSVPHRASREKSKKQKALDTKKSMKSKTGSGTFKTKTAKSSRKGSKADIDSATTVDV